MIYSSTFFKNQAVFYLFTISKLEMNERYLWPSVSFNLTVLAHVVKHLDNTGFMY